MLGTLNSALHSEWRDDGAMRRARRPPRESSTLASLAAVRADGGLGLGDGAEEQPAVHFRRRMLGVTGAPVGADGHGLDVGAGPARAVDLVDDDRAVEHLQ